MMKRANTPPAFHLFGNHETVCGTEGSCRRIAGKNEASNRDQHSALGIKDDFGTRNRRLIAEQLGGEKGASLVHILLLCRGAENMRTPSSMRAH
jgi:hypothetical protein